MPRCCVVLAWVCWRAIWDAQVKCRGIQKGGFCCFWEVKELTSGIQQDTSYSWLHFSGDVQKKFLLEYLVLFFAQFEHWHENYRFTYPLRRGNLSDGPLKQITNFSSLLNGIGYKELSKYQYNANKLLEIIALYWYILQHSWRGAHTFVCITVLEETKGKRKSSKPMKSKMPAFRVFFFFNTRITLAARR